jgi:serine/threonine-protein kinase HipA
MTSKESISKKLYVWIWLPQATDPVVAGVLTSTDRKVGGETVLSFTYAKSYQSLSNRISLFTKELPLQVEPNYPSNPGVGRSALALHGCIRDCAPDAWGRRVINQRIAGDLNVELDELTYLANSGSNRVGALDFQNSPTKYISRGTTATLEQLMSAAELIEAGEAIPEELQAAAAHGTSIGGATPKALLNDEGRELIVKFASTTDTRPVVQAEAAATFLAARVGIRTTSSEIRTVLGKKVMLLERFDRTPLGERKQMLSALTILGQSEMSARHSSYADLADEIRKGPWNQVAATLRQLFTRLVFNVCIGNTDDHLRNHAAFWDGERLSLTPAFDLTPQRRLGEIATHAIAITREGERESQLRLCRKVAASFQLSAQEAEGIINDVVSAIRRSWKDAIKHAGLSTNEAERLMGREFLNPYIFYEQP